MDILNKGKIKDFYHFESEIGASNHSVVRGVHIEEGREVAIKIISMKNMSEEDMGYLYNEIQILSEVDHPNIVQLIEVFEATDDKLFFMVFEYMKGGTLAEKIGDMDYFPEKKAAKILFPIADAMNYCHNLGIVHRDLKPDNLLQENLNSDSNLKVSDFGMATVSSGELMTTICGSKDYIEIINEDPYGPEVDCWSFGVILYYILSGEVPFQGQDDHSKFSAIKKGEWEFGSAIWDEISKEAKELITTLLVLDPAKRITSDEVLEHPWFKLAEE